MAFPHDGRKMKKGETLNPHGRPRKLPQLDKLLADVLGEEKNGITAAEIILQALRAKAARGDVRAAEVLLDRGWGKPRQTIELDEVIKTYTISGPGDQDPTGHGK